jgi:uncharacterized protein YecE (DUF72 family)
MSNFYLGTSGYNYKHWQSIFYPDNLPQRQWLNYYAKHFSTVELNVTFYRLPRESSFDRWYQVTPPNFCFSLKGSRYITHIKRLDNCHEELNSFFQVARRLKNKLSIVLWQLPPSLKLDLELLANFCKALESNPLSRSVRQAFEFRHSSWFSDETYNLLSNFNFALCIAHSTRWPIKKVRTASYTYLRFHGGEKLYDSNYTDEELGEWGNYCYKLLSNGFDVYVYFNNDMSGYAVNNAKSLGKLVIKK